MPGFFNKVGAYMPGPAGAMMAGATIGAMKSGISAYRNTGPVTSFQLNKGVTDQQIYDTAMNGGDASSIGRSVTEPAGTGRKVMNGIGGGMGGAFKGAMLGGTVYGAAHMAMKHQARLATIGRSGIMAANRGFSKIRGLFR